MRNLLSSIDFGKLLEEKGTDSFLYRERRIEYDKVLTHVPELWMFIPASYEGEPTLKPDPKDYQGGKSNGDFKDDFIGWKIAKDRVIFKDFEIYVSGGLRKESEEEIPLDQSVGIKNILHIFWKKGSGEKFVLSHGIKTLNDLVQFNLEVTEEFYNRYYK